MTLENWQKDFAALAFNVPIDIANQVLLNQPIARALSSADTNEILEISQSAGFKEILPDVLEERLVMLARESAEVFSNASKNINGLNLEGELNRSIWSQFDRVSFPVKRTVHKESFPIVGCDKSTGLLHAARHGAGVHCRWSPISL